MANLWRCARAAGFGAVTGALFLGLGGRAVMRIFALTTARPPAFTLSGTGVVVMAGAIIGALDALLLAVLERWLPQRRWLRNVVVVALPYAIAIPGFRPPWPRVFLLFGAAFLGYGLTLAALWDRVVWRNGKETAG